MSVVLDPDNLDRFKIAIDPVGEIISVRGEGSTVRHAIDSTGSSAGTVTFTDGGANFTSDGVVAGDVLTIISDPAADGGIIGHYRVVTVSTTSLTVERSIPSSSGADLDYRISDIGVTGGSPEDVSDGVDIQALFSWLKEEYITLSAGLGNAEDLNKYDFPMVSISSAAGQYILGGINGDAASTWAFAADNGVEPTDTEGVPRDLIRNGGWQERDALDRVLREYANYTTLPQAGGIDADAQVYYQQGDATGSPTDFKLVGAVNQTLLTLGPDVTDPSPGFNINSSTQITRADGGDWVVDNYRVGDHIVIALAEDSPNNGSHGPITAVTGGVDGIITIASASFTTNADDVTMVIQVDHRRFTELRVRKKGKTFTQAGHTAAGIPTAGILPLLNRFPLAHAPDTATRIADSGIDDGIISGGDGSAAGDIFQQIETQTAASDGVTPSALAADGTFTFTSAGGGFQDQARSIDILQPGDSLEITSGSYQGVYEIQAITSDTALNLFSESDRAYPGAETTLSFTARTGVKDIGHTNGVAADIDGDTGTLTSATSTFGVDTAIGDREVVADDILEIHAGNAAVLGYYKVISVGATVLTVNTSDQIFSGETALSYRVWRPGMFLQRFASSATTGGSSTSIVFDDTNPDGINRVVGNTWAADGFTAGMALTVVAAEDAGNVKTFIIDTIDSGTDLTLIASEVVVPNADDTTASVDGNITGDSGITRAINSVVYPFHWRLFAHSATLIQAFQFIDREMRRATDVDGGSGTRRGDIEPLLMTFVSPNGTTLDMFPDDLASAEANNTTYQDISSDSRNNAFLVGITFDVNANLIAATNSRLVAYFTTNPSGNFGTNNAVIVQDEVPGNMDFSSIAGDIQRSFDYTNNAQGGRTPDQDAAITVVALGDDDAVHTLVTATITKVNALTIVVGTPKELNYNNP